MPKFVGLNTSGTIVGTVHPYSSTTLPYGFLVCDGTAVSRTTYAQLFAIISTSFGIGDGTNTFNLPDLRGRFIRGFDNGAGNDPDTLTRTALHSGATGDAIGSYQSHAMLNHQHFGAFYANAGTGVTGQSSTDVGVNPNVGGNPTNWNNSPDPTPPANVSSESRPINLYLQYIIAYTS